MTLGDSEFARKLEKIKSTTVGKNYPDNKPKSVEPKEITDEDLPEVIDARTPDKTDDGLGKGWRTIRHDA